MKKNGQCRFTLSEQDIRILIDAITFYGLGHAGALDYADRITDSQKIRKRLRAVVEGIVEEGVKQEPNAVGGEVV